MTLLLLCGCERAGADYENRTKGTVIIDDALKPEEVSDGYVSGPAVQLAAGQNMLSVWYVGEHQFLDIVTSKGNPFRYEGASLDALARRCPKHCILRITEDGVIPVETDFFGKPET